jgi:pimeloyl-ACP methyl ester carboxylesterase
MQVVIDGILTHYQAVGNKSKVLLILPGWMRTTDEWLTAAKLLSKDYKVILLDLPGFGKTQRPQTTFSIYDYAEFVEHFLDKLEIKRLTLLGHSFGGRLGIILASKTARVSYLILVDSAAVEKKNKTTKLLITINKLLIVPIKLFFPTKVEKIKSRFGSDDYQNAGPMRDIFIQTVNEDLTPLLSKIHVPTFIIWGEKDAIRPIKEGAFIKNNIRQSRLRVVWNAYHSPHLEKPKEFMEILNDYLKNK